MYLQDKRNQRYVSIAFDHCKWTLIKYRVASFTKYIGSPNRSPRNGNLGWSRMDHGALYICTVLVE